MIPFIKYISESYVRCVRRNTKKHTSTGNWQPTIAHDNGNDHSSSLATSFLIPKRNYYSCFIFVFMSPGATEKLCLGDLLVMGSNPEIASLQMQG